MQHICFLHQLVIGLKKKMHIELNAQKKILATDKNRARNPLITGQMLYSLSYRDSREELNHWLNSCSFPLEIRLNIASSYQWLRIFSEHSTWTLLLLVTLLTIFQFCILYKCILRETIQHLSLLKWTFKTFHKIYLNLIYLNLTSIYLMLLRQNNHSNWTKRRAGDHRSYFGSEGTQAFRIFVVFHFQQWQWNSEICWNTKDENNSNNNHRQDNHVSVSSGFFNNYTNNNKIKKKYFKSPTVFNIYITLEIFPTFYM